MRIYEYIIRRAVLMVFVLVGVSLITFYLARGFPSAVPPWAPYTNIHCNAACVQNVIHEHGFDQPLYIQYFYWVRDILSGNWGVAGTWASGQNVFKLFSLRFPFTAELAIAGTILTVAIGIPLGIISAVRNNRPVDHAARVFALTGISTPAYWFGFMLQLVFYYYFLKWGLPYLPSSEAVSSLPAFQSVVPTITGMPLVDALITGHWGWAEDALSHLILPAFTLSFISIGALTRLTRASMLEVLRQDYITLARSKGLRERVVIFRHALRNALIPALTVSGLLFAALLGGAVITETVFTWPGVGLLSLTAVLNSDSNFILLYTLITATIVVCANLVVDVLYAAVDPRIRY